MSSAESPEQNEPTTINDGQYGGFPSPADDYLHRPLDLNERLAPHPTTTFFIQVTGNNLAADHIFNGDTLIIDRAEDCRDGHLVLAVVEGQFLLRRLRLCEGRFRLCSSNIELPEIDVNENCEIWGRVMWSLTKH